VNPSTPGDFTTLADYECPVHGRHETGLKYDYVIGKRQ
jgi:hypothetical protein